MSRLAKKPLILPPGVELNVQGHTVHVKGKKGAFTFDLDSAVILETKDNLVHIRAKKESTPMVGTTCKLISNLIQGSSAGFERKLQLVGVGYRAKVQGSTLELSLGFSNPVMYAIPEGITIEAPSVTEIIVKGNDKQRVGQVAAKIRAFRPPEPYKGKGIRYSDEKVVIKETKKK